MNNDSTSKSFTHLFLLVFPQRRPPRARRSQRVAGVVCGGGGARPSGDRGGGVRAIALQPWGTSPCVSR